MMSTIKHENNLSGIKLSDKLPEIEKIKYRRQWRMFRMPRSH